MYSSDKFLALFWLTTTGHQKASKLTGLTLFSAGVKVFYSKKEYLLILQNIFKKANV